MSKIYIIYTLQIFKLQEIKKLPQYIWKKDKNENTRLYLKKNYGHYVGVYVNL